MKYTFDDWSGEEIGHNNITGVIDARLSFCGLTVDVTYDIAKTEPDYTVKIAGEYPDLLMMDPRGTFLIEAVKEAAKDLWYTLLERSWEAKEPSSNDWKEFGL